jgi:hypothetical protein
VCSSNKANGGTGSKTPVSDGYYVDYLAHEIGHQFNAGHTWTGTACGVESQFESLSSVEPGSGSTIMGYAGLCDSDDVKDGSDPYFALASLEQIRRFSLAVYDGETCGVAAAVTVSPPQILAARLRVEDGTCRIPKETGFVLAPKVADVMSNANPDDRSYSFSWEQADLATRRRSLGVHSAGPVFRSQVPVDTPVRYFPTPASRLSDTTVAGEPLTWPVRDFRFSLTVRDMWLSGTSSLDDQSNLGKGRGSFAAEYIDVSVADVEPFDVTKLEPNVDGTDITVTWSTHAALASLLPNGGLSAIATVSVSYDNGLSFGPSVAFNFMDGKGTLAMDACPNTQGRAVLVEVESMPGCSFYAVKAVANVACAASPTTTTTPAPTSRTNETGRPTVTPSTKPPLTSRPGGAPEDESNMMAIFAGSGAAAALITLACFALLVKKTRSSNSIANTEVLDTERGQIVSMPPKSVDML